MQEIVLDSKIKLLDCPGIVLPGKDADDTTAALRNSVKIEELNDLFTPVDAILKRADKSHVSFIFFFRKIGSKIILTKIFVPCDLTLWRFKPLGKISCAWIWLRSQKRLLKSSHKPLLAFLL